MPCRCFFCESSKELVYGRAFDCLAAVVRRSMLLFTFFMCMLVFWYTVLRCTRYQFFKGHKKRNFYTARYPKDAVNIFISPLIDNHTIKRSLKQNAISNTFKTRLIDMVTCKNEICKMDYHHYISQEQNNNICIWLVWLDGEV